MSASDASDPNGSCPSSEDYHMYDSDASDPNGSYHPPGGAIFRLRRCLALICQLRRDCHYCPRVALIPEFLSLVAEVLNMHEFEHFDEEELVELPWLLADSLFACRLFSADGHDTGATEAGLNVALPHCTRLAGLDRDLGDILRSLPLTASAGLPAFDRSFVDRLSDMMLTESSVHKLCDLLESELDRTYPSCHAVLTKLRVCLAGVEDCGLPLSVLKWTGVPTAVLRVLHVVRMQQVLSQDSDRWKLVSTTALDYLGLFDCLSDPDFLDYIPSWLLSSPLQTRSELLLSARVPPPLCNWAERDLAESSVRQELELISAEYYAFRWYLMDTDQLAIVRAFHNNVALRCLRDQYPYRPYLFDDSGLDSGVEEVLHDLASASDSS